MRKKKVLKRQLFIALIGMGVCVAIIMFCYHSVEQAIIMNEQDSLKSLAKVNARSLLSSLETKSQLIYAVFSGDMSETADIEKGLLKLGEKGKYIPVSEWSTHKEWEQKQCKEAGMSPGTVVVGPVERTNEGYYVLYMTKAVYMNGSITGCVQVELNLDEIYSKEQALSSLQLKNDGYCIIKDSNGKTVMPSDYGEEGIAFSYATGNGCNVEWAYEAQDGTPQRIRKLIAYETIELANEEFTLYIIEDYDKVTQPIEQIAIYFCMFGTLLLAWTIWFMRRSGEQQKKEELLVKELQYERALNETMKKQEGLMQKYNHTKTMSVLTSSIAHEFNNLMTPIVLYADLLEENEAVYQEMPEEIAELKSATKRCEELARQLLSYSRQGKAEKVLTDYDAAFAISEAVNIVRKLIPANIELSENICKSSCYVHGQIGAMNQILLNLVTNAVNSMQNGGRLSIQFGISTDNERDVRLIVEDTGIGIPPEIQQEVFHPFFTTNQGKGTGIGLTVVKQLTEEHGGRIRVKTEVGKGTMFILDFPRVNGEPQS